MARYKTEAFQCGHGYFTRYAYPKRIDTFYTYIIKIQVTSLCFRSTSVLYKFRALGAKAANSVSIYQDVNIH